MVAFSNSGRGSEFKSRCVLFFFFFFPESDFSPTFSFTRTCGGIAAPVLDISICFDQTFFGLLDMPFCSVTFVWIDCAPYFGLNPFW